MGVRVMSAQGQKKISRDLFNILHLQEGSPSFSWFGMGCRHARQNNPEFRKLAGPRIDLD